MPARDVELIVLGSGTSAGIPSIGCECDVCTSDDPRDRRTRPASCVQFTDDGGKPRVILIDTSPDLREQALRHKLKRCDAIVYTHNHVDHTFGLDDVRRFNVLMHSPIDIYGEESTLKFLSRVYRHILAQHKNINESFVATLIPHEIDVQRPLDLHGLRFTPLRLLHGKQPVLGYRIEALDGPDRIADAQPGPLPLCYCTDVSGIPPETWPKLEGTRTLILDLLRYRKHPTHFCRDEAVDVADRIGADRTFFIHMSHDVRHADLDENLPPGMRLAHDGLVIR